MVGTEVTKAAGEAYDWSDERTEQEIFELNRNDTIMRLRLLFGTIPANPIVACAIILN